MKIKLLMDGKSNLTNIVPVFFLLERCQDSGAYQPKNLCVRKGGTQIDGRAFLIIDTI